MKLHQPVLLEQTIELLDPKPGNKVIDMTAGYGGHAEAILKRIGTTGELILIDRDNDAIEHLQRKFGGNTNVAILQSNFTHINWSEIGQIDLALMDLGVSSPQLDSNERGFSFSKEANLDMRMDRSQALSALQIVNEYSEGELADIIYYYGEEPRSRKIAKEIVKIRTDKPIVSTKELALIIEKVVPKHSKIHPATKTFQAIRISVNDELNNLEKTLPLVCKQLRAGGRLAVISFHSLEDRIVKQYFKSITRTETDPVTGGVIGSPNFRLVNKKPVKGINHDDNPRSRSALLRVVEKIN